MARTDSPDSTEPIGSPGSDFDLMRRIAEASATAICAEAAAAEEDEAQIAIRRAIAQEEASRRLRGALELAASQDAVAMHALRMAVCEFTFAHRGEGLSPEHVLIALKNLVDSRALPPILRQRSDTDANRLRESVSAWCIKAYFNTEGACT